MDAMPNPVPEAAGEGVRPSVVPGGAKRREIAALSGRAASFRPAWHIKFRPLICINSGNLRNFARTTERAASGARLNFRRMIFIAARGAQPTLCNVAATKKAQETHMMISMAEYVKRLLSC
jgi:hypothetical protein